MSRKNTKKLLSVILSLVMVISYLPASSFAFAENGDAEPAVEAELNSGNENTGDNDTTVDTDTNTNDDSDQVKEDDKEDPPAVEEKEEKKDEQAEPKEEGKKVEANTEAKEPAKGSEEEEDEEPAGGDTPKDVASGDHSADIMDFIPPGTITMIHKSDNSPVNEDHPARPGETVVLALTNIRETIGEDQFDMTDEMTLNIPAGLDPPNPSVTGTSTVYVTDYSVTPPQVYEMENTYVIGSDGVIRYQWNTDCKEERPPGSGNIVDVYALACQAENFKYDLSFEIKVGSDADSIDFGHGITFPVDRSVALTVKKDIEIPGMTSISQAEAQQMTFALYYEDGVTPVKDKNGNDITFTRNDMTGSGLTNAKWEISGLTAAEYPAVFVVNIYNMNLGRTVSPEEMISHSFYMRHTEDFYEFYKDKLIYENAQPNNCHKALAELERQGKVKAVVTQNIDGLHQKAGSKVVWELHGSTLRNYCERCHAFYGVEKVLESKGVPYCDKCGGRIKPDVVLYEEGLDSDVIDGAVRAISHADTLIVGGTTLIVYPAAGLIHYFHGKKLVLINMSATNADSSADLVIHERIGEVFAQVMGW